jgi:glutathione synthase/RimK-type ligase-like ATP-grasp enzyme
MLQSRLDTPMPITTNCSDQNGHGECAAHDNDTRDARFPLSSSLDETTSHSTKLQNTATKSLVTPEGERDNVSLRDDHVTPFIGLASLMQMVLSGADLAHLVNIAAYNPNDANMLMSLSIIFQLTGSREMGLELQGKALGIRQLYHLPAANGKTGIRLLAILKPGDMMDNTPVDFLLEDSDVALDLLYVSSELPFPESLPDHDLLIVAIGESDQNQPLLEQVGNLIKSSPHPILNAPNQIARLSRDGVSELLKSSPGVEIPITLRIDRAGLQQICRGEKSITALLEDGNFPIIIRPLGSHAGKGLAKIDSPAAVAEYLDATPGNEFNVARFVDYRGSDGLYRKCRIVLIDGQPFACHLAISENWMIHYKNAEMSESAAKRAEEERFMVDFDQDFGNRHKEAFRIIGECIGLDYLVIDCGETPEGDLLIFEADNLGFIHAMDPVDIFPYKKPQMHKVFGAFQEMLRKAKDRGTMVAMP